LQYRAEIDGLRAVAVVPVVLFHAGFTTFSGGYVGVDVFFVVSGYLITSILLEERRLGIFTLAGFYERRARRILPALFFVLLVSLPFAWAWSVPSDMKDYSASLAAIAVFASNILFWKESGYFGAANELKPLLHTWSLSVEEQYYLFFPLFLMGISRLSRRRVIFILALVALLSLALAIWGAANRPVATFFLLPTRAWELMAGVFLAFHLHTKSMPLLPARYSELLGLLGIALVAGSVLAFDEATAQFGPAMLLPVLGAALVILFAGPHSWVGRLLGSSTLVRLGLISYSVYLWHQPVFAFSRQRSMNALGAVELLALSAMVVGLAYFSWRYVERPFRDPSITSRRTLCIVGLTFTLAFILVGLVGYLNGGLPWRLNAEALQYHTDNERHSALIYDKTCNAEQDDLAAKNCRRGATEREPTVMLWGDSIASSLATALSDSLAASHIGALQNTKYGCPPTTKLEKVPSIHCSSHADSVVRHIREKDIRTVILVAAWQHYLEGDAFDNLEGGSIPGNVLFDAPGSSTTAVTTDRELRIVHAYRESILQLLHDGRRVILVYPIPEVGWNVSNFIMKNLMHNRIGDWRSDSLSTSHAVYRNRTRQTQEALDGIGEHKNLTRVRPESMFCNTYVKDRCAAVFQGKQFYLDDRHLSEQGARLVVDQILTLGALH